MNTIPLHIAGLAFNHPGTQNAMRARALLIMQQLRNAEVEKTDAEDKTIAIIANFYGLTEEKATAIVKQMYN